ncbi:MAG: SRPBCC family protein [Pararhodobacter sp.]|nr:SRPBCC family protein [Pararhodobacter sp.]
MQNITGFFGLTFEDRIFIAATPERGFAFFEKMEENYTRWHPDHIAFEWRKGRGLAVGNVFWFDEWIGGKRMAKQVRLVEVVPARLMVFEPTFWLLRAFLPRMSFAFIPEPGGFIFEAKIVMRGIGALGRRLNRRDFLAVERHMAQEGQNLKNLLETGSA